MARKAKGLGHQLTPVPLSTTRGVSYSAMVVVERAVRAGNRRESVSTSQRRKSWVFDRARPNDVFAPAQRSSPATEKAPSALILCRTGSTDGSYREVSVSPSSDAVNRRLLHPHSRRTFVLRYFRCNSLGDA